MSMTFDSSSVVLEGDCTVDDAEELFQWLQEQPDGTVNLQCITHIHSAVLQVLMAVKPNVSVMPENEEVATWLVPVITASR